MNFIQLQEEISLLELEFRYSNLFLFHHVIKGDFARTAQSVELIEYYVIFHCRTTTINYLDFSSKRNIEESFAYLEFFFLALNK